MLGIIWSLFHLVMRGAAVVNDNVENVKIKEKTNDGFTYRDTNMNEYLSSNDHRVYRMELYKFSNGTWNVHNLIVRDGEATSGDYIMYDDVTKRIVKNFTMEQNRPEKRAVRENKARAELDDFIKRKHYYDQEIARINRRNLKLQNEYYSVKSNLRDPALYEKIKKLSAEKVYLEMENKYGVEWMKQHGQYDPEISLESKF